MDKTSIIAKIIQSTKCKPGTSILEMLETNIVNFVMLTDTYFEDSEIFTTKSTTDNATDKAKSDLSLFL